MSKKSDRREGAKAAQDLEDIRTLQKSPAWARYFQRRVVGEVQRLRENILTNRELTKDQLWEERLKFFAAFDTANMMLQDEAACRAMIDQMPPREPEESEDSPTTAE